MYIQYFDDENNRDLVSGIILELDTLGMHGMIKGLVHGIQLIVDNLPTLPETEAEDFNRAEQHRLELNNAINLAGMLIDLINVVLDRKTFINIDLKEDLIRARIAFLGLQAKKDERISMVHKEMGDLLDLELDFRHSHICR